jgi:hypothetical protein
MYSTAGERSRYTRGQWLALIAAVVACGPAIIKGLWHFEASSA